MTDLTKDGKNMGAITFTAHTYYTSSSGIMLLPNENGKGYTLREGTLGKFETTEKMLECDSNGVPAKITQPSRIPRSNISLPYVLTVKIQEQSTKEEHTKTGISKRILFQSKEELDKQARPLTQEETKKKFRIF